MYMSLYTLKVQCFIASGAIQQSGSFPSVLEQYTRLSHSCLAKPKSDIFRTLLVPTRTLRQARSLCIIPRLDRYS